MNIGTIERAASWEIAVHACSMSAHTGTVAGTYIHVFDLVPWAAEVWEPVLVASCDPGAAGGTYSEAWGVCPVQAAEAVCKIWTLYLSYNSISPGCVEGAFCFQDQGGQAWRGERRRGGVSPFVDP